MYKTTDAYIEGFCKTAEDNWVDPVMLIKSAAIKFKDIEALMRAVSKHTKTIPDFGMRVDAAGRQIIKDTLMHRLAKFDYPTTSANPRDWLYPYADATARRKMFPRFALFKGSNSIDGAGGAAAEGFGSMYGISGSSIPGGGTGMFTHVAQDPRQAELYGRILSVWNARKVPGAVTGKFQFFPNLMAETHASPDFTVAKGLYGTPLNTGMPRRVKLDTRRGDYLNTFGDDVSRFGSNRNLQEAEALLDISRYKPQRVYLHGRGGMYDITQFARYRRAHPDSSGYIDAIIDAIR